MNKKLYVGNLTSSVTEDDLRASFEQVGPVTSVAIIKDKYSNQSKGFGFVEMEKQADAEKAVSMLNRGMLDGKAIDVSEAREKREGGFKGGRPGGGGYRGGGRPGGGGGGRGRY